MLFADGSNLKYMLHNIFMCNSQGKDEQNGLKSQRK